MRKIVFFTIALLMSGSTIAAVLEAHVRHRPPDLKVEGDQFSGPLKDILDMAAERAGHNINWSSAPFKRSIEDLKSGEVDFVPRTFKREDRKVFAHFLDPVGFQEKSTVFLVKKGNESSIASYEDLTKLSIGVKRGAVYFKQFDDDSNLQKVENTDDKGLTKMLAGGRIDTMISIDLKAAEEKFKEIGFDYGVSDFKNVNRTGVFYASSKKRYESDRKEAYDAINGEIKKMVASGEIDKIYVKYGAVAPLR